MRSHAKASTAGSRQGHTDAGHLARLALLTLICLLALAPSALAAPSRSFEKFIGASQFAASAANPQALTVDQSNGDIYAINTALSAVHRLDSAGNAKNFTAGPNAGTNTLTGFSFGTTIGAAQVAVDNSGGPADGDVYVTDTNNDAVKVFANDGSLLATLTGSGTPAGVFAEPCGVAVDQSNGNLYVADRAERIWRYSPVADPVAEADYSGGIVTTNPSATLFKPCQVAAGSGSVYVVEKAEVLTAPLYRFAASGFALGPPPSPASVQIDPLATAVAVDPSSGEVYVNKGGEIAVHSPAGAKIYGFGTSSDFGTTSGGIAVMGSNGPAYVSDRRAAATPGRHIDVFAPAVVPVKLGVEKTPSGSGVVSSSPAGINCGPTCQAEFIKGGEVTLTASANAGSKFKEWSGCDSVTVDDKCKVTMSVEREVTATFATRPAISEETPYPHDTTARLEATLDPESEATKYQFQYVEQADFEAEGYFAAKVAPIPAGSLPAGDKGVPVSVQIEGLKPSTIHHFRLIAFNSLGTTEGSDETFVTHAPEQAFGPCPNDAFRIDQPSDALPDCRGYEQASPTNKNGGDVSGTYPIVHASIDGDAVSFGSQSGLPGGEGAQELPSYLARRSSGAWSTQGILPPQSEGENGGILGWTTDFSHVFGESRRFGEPSTKTFLTRSIDDGSLEAIVPHTALTGGGSFSFAGASADGSRVFFEATGAELVPGAASGENNLYAWDRDSEELSLVGQVPLAPDTECGIAPLCTTPPEGSSAGIGGGSSYTQDQHAISDDGDRAYFTAGDTGQLYLRDNPTVGAGASTVHVSASQRTVPDPLGARSAAFMAATPDGSAAFFTSAEKLTDDATTGPDAPPPAIARADIGGTPASVDLDFLSARASGVAVDGTHIYWADSVAGTIGRAKLNGDELDEAFITGAGTPQYVAVDANYVYWTNAGDGGEGNGTIGRATLDGTTEVKQDFITGASKPQGIVINATHIYWANVIGSLEGGVGANGSIGRADLSGASPEPKWHDIGGNEAPHGMAINTTHIYWTTNNPNGFVSRAKLDGSTEEFAFIGAGDVDLRGIAVDANYVYWVSRGKEAIGRANLGGFEDLKQEFIKTNGNLKGLAVDSEHIYWSVNGEVPPNPGDDLYRYDADTGELTDLTVDTADVNGAEVRGVLGVSDDGSDVYLVANGVLTSTPNGAGEEAEPGDCEAAIFGAGTCNLYRLHEGGIDFIAGLEQGGGAGFTDAANWTPTPVGGFVGAGFNFQKTARVSADGGVLLFRSQRQLTAYDNDGISQLYRYEVGDGGIDCVSCNPSGAAPVGTPSEKIQTDVLSPTPPAAILTRSLSADGSRVFFESTDPLLAADTNGDGGCPTALGNPAGPACQDVYLWEAKGSGSCESEAQNGGCLYLISTGKSPFPSFFADASVTGDDVFVITRSQLVRQDKDQLFDAYDARVGGGIASQNEAPPAPCEGEGCKPGASAPPGSESAGTASFSGPGNPIARKPKPRCPKGRRKVRRAGKVRCVRRPRQRRVNHRANADRRAHR